MTLHVVTYFWGEKYDFDYVYKLCESVRRNLTLEHRFMCIMDREVDKRGMRIDMIPANLDYVAIPDSDLHLLDVRGCFARLRLFDTRFLGPLDIREGDAVVCIDLDCVVTGSLDEVLGREEPFVILQGANSANPCPYNGSLWMLRAGYRSDVWSRFSLEAAALVPHDEFPDDQAWLADKIPGAAGWRAGQDGVYAFHKPGWPRGDDLPPDARVVFFPGRRDPSQFTHLDWVQKHWRV